MRTGRERAQRNLYVLNLPLDATTDQFEALFAQFGSVKHAVILATLDHLARRRGFILMSDPTQARQAIEHLHGHEWHNYRIEVSFAIVQRSGTPFSHACVESPADDRSTQASTADAPSQWNTDHGQGRTEPPASLRTDETTLLLFGLNSSVITSSAMVRALTEPFGHIVDLRRFESRHDPVEGGRAMVKYCCSSSAALARLSLNGLVIGVSMVQTIIPQTQAPAAHSLRDTDTDTAAMSVRPSGVPPYDSGPNSNEHSVAIPHTLSSSSMPPRQSDMTPCRSSSASAQASESHARGPRLDPWGDSSISNPATNKNDDEDHILVDRRDRPRPIGDERQRPTFKKS